MTMTTVAQNSAVHERDEWSVAPFSRELHYARGNGNTTSTNDAESTQGSRAVDTLDFVAFIAWYIFLVLCCVVPCICYRRRRLGDQRLLRQEYLQALAAQGLVVLGNGQQASAGCQDSEDDRKERLRKLEDVLKATTMIVTAQDLLKKEDLDDPNAGTKTSKEEDDEEQAVPSRGDVDLGDEADREFLLLQLDAKAVNGFRRVPAGCSICLCRYEVGDSVTHSPHAACMHAFHTECVTTWLAKKQDALCPCCRQPFCEFCEHAPVCQMASSHDSAGEDRQVYTNGSMTFETTEADPGDWGLGRY